jgi:hypothetical protein
MGDENKLADSMQTVVKAHAILASFHSEACSRGCCVWRIASLRPTSASARPRKTRFRLEALPWPGGTRTRWVAHLVSVTWWLHMASS